MHHTDLPPVLRGLESLVGAAETASDAPVPAALSPSQLYRHTDDSALNFQTTADLSPLDGLVGQQRALGALQFGTQIRQSGFNLFVTGSPGSRMQEVVGSMLRRVQSDRPTPSDWVYVNNFDDSRQPIAIQLPPGRAVALRDTMQQVIDDLKVALPALFESEDYQARHAAIDQKFQAKQGEAFAKLGERAAGADMALVRTPMGFMIAPVRDGKVVPSDEFSAWPEADRKAAETAIETLQNELEQIVRQIPLWEKEHRDEVQKLDRQTALVAIDQSINDARRRFSDVSSIEKYLETVRLTLSTTLRSSSQSLRATWARYLTQRLAIRSTAITSMCSLARTRRMVRYRSYASFIRLLPTSSVRSSTSRRMAFSSRTFG